MLSLPSEMPPASGALASSGSITPPAAGTAGGADFAGLLEAALPRGGEVTGGAAELAPALPDAASSGKSLPSQGTALPPLTAETALTPGAGETNAPAAAPAPAPAALLLRERGGTLAGVPLAAVPLEQVQGEAAPPHLARVEDGAGEDAAQAEPAAVPSKDQPSPPLSLAAAVRDDDNPAPTDDPASGTAALVLASAPPPPALTPPPRADALPIIRGGIAPLPARVMLPAAGPASPFPGEDSAAPAPPTHPAEGLAEAPAQSAQPAATPPAAPPLAAPGTPAPQPALTPAPTPALTPAAAEPALAPQLEQTIAQADTLREALRAARPELTLRHAEFGAVSLRLEATGSESWRAVLSARDPGFVPAIQAALAERAIAAATPADTAGSFLSQNGTSDQRYGASPNGGQGGHSPHLSQSGTRDGEAAPDHRRPSTAATLAGRDQQEGEGSGSSPARQSRGLFA